MALTLRSANRREDIRWQRESARLEAEALHRSTEEHAAWLRDQRLTAYAELVKLGQDFWMELTPLISVLERQDDPASELNRVRMALFRSIWQSRLLADAELQKALQRLADAAENVGHRPYADESGRGSAWRQELYDDAHSAANLVEEAVRSELDLPARAPYKR